jgi:hypothetical protein
MKAKFVSWFKIRRRAAYLSRVVEHLINRHDWEAADYVARYRRIVMYEKP